jgi:hypothetical protein
MTLSVRPEPYIIPSYSLTGDLLAYRNCGRQYRYQNRGALPPSKPVQLWFGQFIHGVMEESYRRWRAQRDSWAFGGGARNLLDFPWDDDMLAPIIDDVISRLAAQGLVYRNRAMLELAINRAREAINSIGRWLFLLIDQAEVRLSGIREMPLPQGNIRRADYYEVTGVADVLTSVQLSTADPSNLILRALLDNTDVSAIVQAARRQGQSQNFEIIVDYKGMRRPADQPDTAGDNDDTIQRYEWQLQTYAWLREQQQGASRVLAGILLFVNELVPSNEDIRALRSELFGPLGPRSSITPPPSDLIMLQNWRPGTPISLSLEYRLARAIHVVPMTDVTIQDSLQNFDSVVSEIETSVCQERLGGTIDQSWRARPVERNCTVCDFKNFCSESPYRGTPFAP